MRKGVDVKDVACQLRALKSPKHGSKLGIGSEEIPFSDMGRVNEFLLPEYFYCYASVRGNLVFFLGEVREQRKTRIDGKRINELIIGEELVSNLPFYVPAFVNVKRGFVVGRAGSASELVWDKVYGLRIAPVASRASSGLLFKAFSCFGLEREDVLTGEKEDLEEKVGEIAGKSLEAGLAHERGHVLEKEFLPREVFVDSVNCARKYGDSKLEDFVYALSEALADTLENKKVKGRYPHILSLGEPDRTGLFCLSCFDIAHPLVDPSFLELSALEGGLLSALPVYERTGDLGVLEYACDNVRKRSKLIAKKVCEAGSYEELKKVQRKFERGRGLK